MALIEGFGDEVLVTFAVICIIISLVVAWVSTRVQDVQFTSASFANTSAQQAAEQAQTSSTVESSQVSSTDTGTVTNASSPTEASDVSLPDSNGETTSHDLENPDHGVTTDNSSFSGIQTRTALPDDSTSAGDQHVTPNIPVTHETSSEQLNSDESTDSNTAVLSESHNDSMANSPTDSQPNSHLPSTELRKRRINFLTGHLASSTTVPCNVSTQPTVLESVESDHNDLSLSSTTAEGSELLEGHIRLRLKDLSDRERVVQVRPEDTIGHFKRIHFANELAQNKVVRLICNGRELDREDLTIQGYNLTDNCILHCLVRQQQQESTPVNLEAGDELEVGMYMFPMFGLILALVWYCRVVYRELFDPMATFSLIGMTMVFLVAMAASFFNQDREQVPIPAHLHVE